MRKITIKITVMIFVAVSMLGLIACGSKPTPPPEPLSPSITVSKSELGLERYADYTLTAQVQNFDGEVTWVSNDTQVATVAGGKVTALSLGTAIITAKAGSAEAKCTVTVTDNSEVPEIIVEHTALELFKNDRITVGAKVKYMSQHYYDAQFAFVSLNPEVAEVSSSGEVTAKAFGTTEITVTAQWRNAPSIYLTTVIAVTVSENISVSAEQTEFLLFVTAEVDGIEFQKTATATAIVKDNGTVIDSPDGLEWESEDSGIASVDKFSGVVSGVSKGVTRIRAVYTGESGFEVSTNWIPVTVNIPVINKTVTGFETDRTTAQLPSAFQSLFGNGEQIVSIADVTDPTEIDLNYEGGEINTLKLKVGERKWSVVNDGYGYTINVIVASKIITHRDELQKMYTEYLKTETNGHYEGYIILGADLDFDGFEYGTSMWGIPGYSFSSFDKSVTDWNSNWADTKTLGFKGVFDGRGHTISNITMCTYGLFPSITEGSVFKNTAFVNVTLNQGDATTVAAVIHGTVDNVSVVVNGYNKWGNAGAISLRTLATGKVSNSMVYMPAVTASSAGAISRISVEGCVIDNVYAVSNLNVFAPDRNGAQIADAGIIFASAQAFKSEKDKASGSVIDLSGFADIYWDKTSTIPLFKRYTSGFQLVADHTELTAGDVLTLQLPSYVQLSLNIESAYEEYITLDGKTISLDYGLNEVIGQEGISFSINASVWSSSESIKTLTFEVAKITKQQTTLSGILYDFDKSSSDDYVITLPSGYTDVTNNSVVRLGAHSVAFEAGNDGETLTVTIPYSAISGIAVGDYTLLIDTEEVIYRQAVSVVSKIIRTEAEFTQLYSYIKTSTVGRYEGYILLGADLDFAGFEYNKEPWNVAGFSVLSYDSDMGALASSNWDSMDAAQGMLGTIDGRGHTIKNLTLRTYGLFTKLAPTGVVKNIAFVDAVFVGDDTTTIAKYNAGTVDNVFVSVKTPPASNKKRSAAISNQLLSTARISNCIVLYSGISTLDATVAAVAQITRAGAVVTNTYAVTDRGAYANNEGALPTANVTYTSIADFLIKRNASPSDIDLSGFNTQYWDFSYDIPVFNRYSGSINITQS